MMKFKLLEFLDVDLLCEMCISHGSETARYKVRFYDLSDYGKRRSAVAKICDTCFSKFKKFYGKEELSEDQYIKLLAETDMFLAGLEKRVRGI
jgi:hypothetical protein